MTSSLLKHDDKSSASFDRSRGTVVKMNGYCITKLHEILARMVAKSDKYAEDPDNGRYHVNAALRMGEELWGPNLQPWPKLASLSKTGLLAARTQSEENVAKDMAKSRTVQQQELAISPYSRFSEEVAEQWLVQLQDLSIHEKVPNEEQLEF